MENFDKNWLPHLNNRPPGISAYRTDIYAMASEGWRRGLTLKFIKAPGYNISPAFKYSLSDGEKEHVFSVARGDAVTPDAIRICEEKPLTYYYLKKNNVPIPEGESFNDTVDNHEIVEYGKKLGFPLVVKPTDGKSGEGVITNIKTVEELENAIKHVREDLNYNNLIIERFIVGIDYRVYVIDGYVAGAYKRITANVIGDGKSTISELIKQKNIKRKNNPFIKNRIIKINQDLKDFLKSNNYSLTSVPDEGERVYVRAHGTYFKERDPVDVTDDMSEHLKQIAVDAVDAIPGLPHCNVDMLINEEEGTGYINEINSRPQISNHLFPMEGKARDIPKAIIDYYFPETIDNAKRNKYYFDLPFIYETLWSGNAKEVTVPDVNRGKIISKRFLLKGVDRTRLFDRNVRKHAILLKLNGYIKTLESGNTSIVVSGTPKRVRQFRDILNNQLKKRFKIQSIAEKFSSKNLRVGFHIIQSKTDKTEEVENLKSELKKYKTQMNKINKEKQKLEDELESIKNSRSQKITKPLRKFSSKFKK